MFDLDVAVRDWRSRLTVEGSLSRDQLDELEDHMRSTHEALVESSLWEPAEAWAWVLERLGRPDELAAEFRKVESVGWRWLLRAGWVLFGLSFLLPVHRFSIALFDTEYLTPGVEAFLLALKGEGGVLGVASALGNLVMLATLWRPGDRARPWLLSLAGTLGAATLLHGWWMIVVDSVSDLQVGFYVWWLSFVLVSAALALRAASAPEARTLLPEGGEGR